MEVVVVMEDNHTERTATGPIVEDHCSLSCDENRHYGFPLEDKHSKGTCSLAVRQMKEVAAGHRLVDGRQIEGQQQSRE